MFSQAKAGHMINAAKIDGCYIVLDRAQYISFMDGFLFGVNSPS